MTSNPNNPSLLGKFQFHSTQPFVFGAQELAGLKIFLTEPAIPPTASPTEVIAGTIGNCLACHAAPNFTDFKLHNTGIAQSEYDTIHGSGAFMALTIPPLIGLNPRTDNDLPATEQHPGASERFRSIPSAGTTLTDLGVWNIFLNPDMPNPQAKIRAILCEEHLPLACPADNTLLDEAIARFKTPGLRDLGHSAPTCTVVSSTLWRTQSDFIRGHRAKRGRERYVTASMHCGVLRFFQPISPRS